MRTAREDDRERRENPAERDAPAEPLPTQDLLRLQRTAGNRAVARLLANQAAKPAGPVLQRFGAGEHVYIGDEATRTGPGSVATLELAPGYSITQGEMVSMAGDLFWSVDQMKELARHPGPGVGSREEIECARVLHIHGDKSRSGEFSEEVRKIVSERYYSLASDNPSHFLNPNEGDVFRPTEDRVNAKDFMGGPIGAGATYRQGHERAVREAVRAGKAGRSDNDARIIEAFSEHFLTDAFSAGHVRVPRSDVKEVWHRRVPMFWTNLQWYLAEKIAWYLNDHSAYGILTVDILISEARETVATAIKKAGFPPLSFGDVISGALHDYDNVTGVWVLVEGSPVQLLGDGQLKWADEIPKAPPAGSGLMNVILQSMYLQKLGRHIAATHTRDLAVEAVKRSVNDISWAYQLGKAGNDEDKAIETLLGGTGLYAAETMLPEVIESPVQGPVSPGGQWNFDSIDALMDDPHIKEALRIFAEEKASEIATVGADLDGAKKEAFEEGFLRPLRTRPLDVMREIIDYVPTTGSGAGFYGHDQDDRALEYYEQAKSEGALGGLTVKQKVRIVRELLSGATVGDEETAILELLEANKAEAPEVIAGAGWEWLYDDLDAHEHVLFIRNFGPSFWPTQDLSAKHEEVARLANGITNWKDEETIMIILRTCSKSEVHALDAQYNLSWDLTDANQDELDAMLAP